MIDDLRLGFTDPPPSAAPMLRWWWFGPSVERDELSRELTAMAEAGFGGVEVAYVYPLGPATTEFMSETFLADLRFAADRAHELGLRFDLTLGSGWSFGGPHITGELAAHRLHWERREITPGSLEIPAAPPWPGDQLLAAYVGAGSIQEQPESFRMLSITNEMIKIPDGQGTRQVLLAYSRRTGQNVKRAAVGSEGPVLDHYSAAAVEAHLRWAGDRMLDAVPAELVGSMFCDSLEVYGADWTPALPDEFARRRGYPLIPVLYRLAVDRPDTAQVRADYHRTLAELYQENFVAVVQRWAASRGVPFRIQSYGTPPATISSYRFADMFEGEGWRWKEITQTRWASSAGHLYGKDVVSAEIWTWVHSPSFRATPLDLKGEAHEHLLLGINQFVGHGWPYSPAEAPGLGWFFYAAGAIDDRNPWWPAMPSLNAYLTRLCWLLRQGEPVADVAIYVPNEDLFAVMGGAIGGSLDAWREANRRIDSTIPATIRTSGLDYDLIDDEAFAIIPPDRYRVVIIPATTMILDEIATWLGKVTAAGGSVIMIDSTVDVPGGVVVAVEELADALAAAIDPDLEIAPSTADIGFVHRHYEDADIYFIANTGPQSQTFRITARGRSGSYEEWHATSGEVVRAGMAVEGIELALVPYHATVIIMINEEPGGAMEPTSADPTAVLPERRIRLDDSWQVAFADEPPQPVHLPHVWEDQPERRHYSGAATYTTSWELADLPREARVVIDFGDCSASDAADQDNAGLVGPSYRVAVTGPVGEIAGLVGPSYRVAVTGPVGEIAEVAVNGVECGVAWHAPYRIDITDAARSGRNEIKITVRNTAANALAADQHILEVAVQSEARYGRRFRMQDLNRAMESVRSGLLSVPTVVVSANN
jgi:alpha-L-rhamnosidase